MPRAELTIKPIPQTHGAPLQNVHEGSTLIVLHQALDFEEAPDPPDLEDALTDEQGHLEDAPPLDARVCRFSSVTVSALADDDIRLLIFHLRDELRERAYCMSSVMCRCRQSRASTRVKAKKHTFFLQWILRRLVLRNIDNAMHIEADLLGVGAPVLVVEAVRVFPILCRNEAMVARRHATLVDLVCTRGRLDPEVDLQVPAAAELAVADLKGDGHFVVLVQLLVEAFAHVGLHLDVVRRRQSDEGTRDCEEGKRRESHRGPYRRS